MKKLRFSNRLKARSSLVPILGIFLLGLLVSACGQQINQPVAVSLLPSPAPTFTPVPVPALSLINRPELGKTTSIATLVGSGSTFADPIYKNWITVFTKTSPQVKLEYQAIGSGSGRSAFLGTPVAATNNLNPTVPVDFAGTDAPFRGSELLSATTKWDIVHIPAAVGGVVAIYNLKEVSHLQLSGPVLADIFQGKITRWNDPAIQNDNPGQGLPDKEIKVTIRSRNSSSGTSEIFTRYLSVVSDDFRTAVGPGSSPKWTITKALEGNSNEAVANLVQNNDGAIGYVDQGVADTMKISYAAIRNKTGRYITPTLDTVSAAALGTAIPDDFRTFIVNGEGINTYPIAGFTWLVTWRDLGQLPNPTRAKAEALGAFLWWAIHDGQNNLPAGYAPLPSPLVPRLERLFIASQANPQDKVFVFNQQPLFTQTTG